MDQIDFRKVFFENLDDLKNLLAIPSMYDENSVSKDMPYGKRVNDALLFMKNLAIRDGFEVKEYDGYAISIEHGEGKRIDIACHLDVVAAKKEDFNIRVEDDTLYGRGSDDMKTPLFLNYLCLKMLKQQYPEFKNKIRLVFGTDEERTMDDMHYYLSKVDAPSFAYTPDGSFPIGIGEKGAIMWTLTGEYEGKIKTLDAGNQCNIVSSYAHCVIKDSDLDRVNKYIALNYIDGKAKLVDDEIDITVNGVKAHASVPFLGHSATIDLLKLIADLYDDEICKSLYDNYANYYGAGFNNYVSDDRMKCLSVNLGILKIEDGKVFGQVDCRYPMGKTALKLTEDLKKVSKVNVSLDYNDDPTMCSLDDVYVKTLYDAYQKVTGNFDLEPVVSGGVSYSKVFKHCVSYGPNQIGKLSTAHQDGEHISITDAIEWFKIYYEAIKNLALLEV